MQDQQHLARQWIELTLCPLHWRWLELGTPFNSRRPLTTSQEARLSRSPVSPGRRITLWQRSLPTVRRRRGQVFNRAAAPVVASTVARAQRLLRPQMARSVCRISHLRGALPSSLALRSSEPTRRKDSPEHHDCVQARPRSESLTVQPRGGTRHRQYAEDLRRVTRRCCEKVGARASRRSAEASSRLAIGI